MSDVSHRYARLVREFAERIGQVPVQQWENQSPCSEWTARDVVRHVVDTQGIFLGLVGRSPGEIPSVDDDPAAAFRAATSAVQADLDDPDRAAAEYDGYFGRTTFAESVDNFLAFDLIVHRWDLARATGGDETITLEDVRWVMGRVSGMGDALRSQNVCGPQVPISQDASEQDRMLACLGRDPR